MIQYEKFVGTSYLIIDLESCKQNMANLLGMIARGG
ncbi:hypothetical protein CK203_099109 [Vitis vinifera]|uniref:Uncharacterized protein n=1 Tax=Vitis vinifera TaxID=29760 RepID=A0A438BTK8_VITVI|nr:hypothetical protein CK203_099109 [Vitis vinifera]